MLEPVREKSVISPLEKQPRDPIPVSRNASAWELYL